jgi:tetratricopeptide (TPR) repeat protein/S1-C subfamily serine protease
MKLNPLLIALTIVTFITATTRPLLVLAQSTSPGKSDSESLTPIEAARVAAKVTVRIGQGNGSGVLLAKRGNTYLVLTNAHVVREQISSTIQTPDGQSHSAKRVLETQLGNVDVALLEFTSTRAYQLVGLENYEGNIRLLEKEDGIFAAGFPYNSNILKFVGGKIKQLPDEAFINGTQIGYTTTGDIEQGMSGGPILDSGGNLVGINSTLAYPIKPTYTYADGSKAPPTKVAEYRQANWGVPIANLLTRIDPAILDRYKQLPRMNRTLAPSGYMAQLDRQARLVTVRIENSGGNGSGFIVARTGNDYYVLTAEHVMFNVEKKSKNLYQNQKIVTHDQRIYTISPSEIKQAAGTDLAVVKFTSTQPYQVATLGNYRVADKSIVFPGGWPGRRKIKNQLWQWQLNPGTVSSEDKAQFKTQDKLSFSNGYDLMYSSVTYGGMSGGPVFDTAGSVIGFHGKAEGDRGTKITLGDSLGISIKTFVGLADRLGIDKHNLKLVNNAPGTLDGTKLASIDLVRNNLAIPKNDSSVDRWIEYGNQLYRLGKYADAVKAFDRAIAIEPTSVLAHYGKGLALFKNKDYPTAIGSFDRAVAVVPAGQERGFYYLWKYRSVTLRFLRRYSEALTAIDRAISLDALDREKPQDIMLFNQKTLLLSNLKRNSESMALHNRIIDLEPKAWAYVNRAGLKDAMGDYQGAIADSDTALKIDPKSALAYLRRGNVKFLSLKDRQGGMTDFDLAVSIDPQSALVYGIRGIGKMNIQDYRGAISDFNTAIDIEREALFYYSRSLVKMNLKDYQGATVDINLAIDIDPRDSDHYHIRGLIKDNQKNHKGAIEDFNIAVKLDPQNAAYYFSRYDSKQKTGDNQGSLEDISNAIRLDPKNAVYYMNRGYIKYSKLNDDLGAIADLNISINLDSKENFSYWIRCQAKSRLGDIKGAIEDLDLAIKLDPQDASNYRNRGDLKSKLKDKQGALADYDLAIKIAPNDAANYADRGAIKSASGDTKGAISDYDFAIKLTPQKPVYYWQRGNLKSELGDNKGALADYNLTIKLSPINNYYYSSRSVVKYRLGDKKGAIADLDLAIKLAPLEYPKLELYVQRGIIQVDLKAYTAAIVDLNTAVKLNPKADSAYFGLGAAKYGLGDLRGSLADYDRSIALNPKNASAYQNAAFIKYDLNDISGAIDYWRKSLNLNPNEPDTQLGLAVALYKQGQTTEAYQLGTAVIKAEKRSTNLDFLRKERTWSEIIIKDAAIFFQAPQISGLR